MPATSLKYVSTRGRAPVLEFEDALLAGLARDGGLYVPEYWPHFSHEQIQNFSGQNYSQVAYEVMAPFVAGQIPEDEFRILIDEAYAGFEHNAVAPLVQIGTNEWILELFHGPTLAFKDFAMQVLARLMDRVLKNRQQRATIVGATSGDTGGAAIDAFRGRDAIDIFILHPHGRVSDVQRRQMTTAADENVYNIALEGTFDDCQALVKDLFNDLTFRDQASLAGVNSINWGRIMAQIVYYFTSATSLGAPHRDISYCVPTGNFGDIFAGFVAKQMGLTIRQLVIATNVNDILARTLETGRYEPLGVMPTQSPSMDIQVSSNFERLLFELSERDSERVSTLMNDLKENNVFELEATELAALRDSFAADRVHENMMVHVISQFYQDIGYVSDPHTAVGLGVVQQQVNDPDVPMVTLATAHPAKFPTVVEKAIGREPHKPKQLTQQLEAEERYDILENNYEAVVAYIAERSRAIKDSSL